MYNLNTENLIWRSGATKHDMSDIVQWRGIVWPCKM